MATKLGKILADFITQLSTKIIVGGTTATLQSATDSDGEVLASGQYYFTIDGDNSRKEHIQAQLVGTALTNIKSVSRQGVITAGVVREHRVGAKIVLTDFYHILAINNVLSGVDPLDSTTPPKFDLNFVPILGQFMLATWDYIKSYIDGIAISGAPDSSDSVKGLVEQATQAEIENNDPSGGTSAPLFIPSGRLTARLFIGYAVDAGSNDTYAATYDPAPTQLLAGMVFELKCATKNTGAATFNPNTLGNKTIKKYGPAGKVDLIDNDIVAGQIVTLLYDGTDMILLSATARIDRSFVQTGFGGTGADGALTIASGTTTIDLGGVRIFIKNYSSIAITGTGALAFTNPHADGTLIVLKSQGAVTITTSATRAIDLRSIGGAGGAGGAINGGDGAAGGSPQGSILSPVGGIGGRGGNNSSFVKIVVSGLGTGVKWLSIAGKAIQVGPGAGGSGGGGGYAAFSGAAGAAGGAGGGGLLIECGGALNFTGTIDASGAAGANGVNGSYPSGPGGGGAGGSVVILYVSLTANSGTINNSGGAGGASYDAAYAGGAGGAGGNGSGTGVGGDGGTSANAQHLIGEAGGGGGACGGGANGVAGTGNGGDLGSAGGGAGGGKLVAQNTEIY